MTRNEFLKNLVHISPLDTNREIVITDDNQFQAAWSTLCRTMQWMEEQVKTFEEAEDARQETDPELIA